MIISIFSLLIVFTASITTFHYYKHIEVLDNYIRGKNIDSIMLRTSLIYAQIIIFFMLFLLIPFNLLIFRFDWFTFALLESFTLLYIFLSLVSIRIIENKGNTIESKRTKEERYTYKNKVYVRNYSKLVYICIFLLFILFITFQILFIHTWNQFLFTSVTSMFLQYIPYFRYRSILNRIDGDEQETRDRMAEIKEIDNQETSKTEKPFNKYIL